MRKMLGLVQTHCVQAGGMLQNACAEGLATCACAQKYEGCLRRAKLTDNTIMLWNDGCATLALPRLQPSSAQCQAQRLCPFPKTWVVCFLAHLYCFGTMAHNGLPSRTS